MSIIVVGAAYSLLLRNLWQPQGLHWLANELLHDVMPVLFTLYWWFCVPKGTLRLSHIAVWALYPIVYFAYLLWRGHTLGMYPYPFIDVNKLGYAQTFVNALGILAGFVAVALLMVAIDRWRGRSIYPGRCAGRCLRGLAATGPGHPYRRQRVRPCSAASLGLEACWLLLWEATLPNDKPP